MSGSEFEAGVGRVVITPPLSAPHAGWGAQTHVYADGVDTDLHVTVLLLRNGESSVALVELDLVIVTRHESESIRVAVAEMLEIPPVNVRVSVTHNHAGPPPSGWNWMPRGREALASYYALLPSLASSAALQASRNCRPARIGVGRGKCQVAVNRREKIDGGMATGVNWDGPIDDDLLVTRIDAVDGSPIASIVGYTMHPTTLGPGNRLISPDWPGHMKLAMERLTGAMCLFVQGATGDIGPGPDGFTDRVADVGRIGTQVACDAASVYLSTPVPPRTYRHERVWHSGAPLGKWTYSEEDQATPELAAIAAAVELPVRPQTPLDEAEAAADSAKARLHDLVDRGAAENEVEDATFAVKRANMTLSRSRTFGGRDSFPIEVHALRIGSLVLVGSECEPFSAIGKAIKQRSPFEHTWFGGYTGGWFGYVPTPDEYPLGGYEVDTSPYEPGAAQALADGVVELLQQMG